jgi:hypothetical protein
MNLLVLVIREMTKTKKPSENRWPKDLIVSIFPDIHG